MRFIIWMLLLLPITAQAHFGDRAYDMPPFHLRESNGEHYILLYGTIDEYATADKFNEFRNNIEKDTPDLFNDVWRVELNSGGGLLFNATELAIEFIVNGFVADVTNEGQCFSACAIMYTLMSRRIFQEGAEIGFHRPYVPEQAESKFDIMHTYVTYYRMWWLAGGDLDLYNHMMSTPRDESFILDRTNIGEYMEVVMYE